MNLKKLCDYRPFKSGFDYSDGTSSEPLTLKEAIAKARRLSYDASEYYDDDDVSYLDESIKILKSTPENQVAAVDKAFDESVPAAEAHGKVLFVTDLIELIMALDSKVKAHFFTTEELREGSPELHGGK